MRVKMQMVFLVWPYHATTEGKNARQQTAPDLLSPGSWLGPVTKCSGPLEAAAGARGAGEPLAQNPPRFPQLVLQAGAVLRQHPPAHLKLLLKGTGGRRVEARGGRMAVLPCPSSRADVSAMHRAPSGLEEGADLFEPEV